MRFYLSGLVLVSTVVSVLMFSSCGMEYSQGVRVGVVQKLSKRGFFCKTWEGEMLMVRANVIQPDKFHFAVVDERVVPGVMEAMRTGREVELEYTQHKFNTPCAPDSEYWVTGVK